MMEREEKSWNASREETRERQILLGLQLTPYERLAWLDRRREELARLRGLMPQAEKVRQ